MRSHKYRIRDGAGSFAVLGGSEPVKVQVKRSEADETAIR